MVTATSIAPTVVAPAGGDAPARKLMRGRMTQVAFGAAAIALGPWSGSWAAL